MIVEITAAIQSVRAVSDLIKANHTLRNFNELVTVVYEVNTKLLAVQSVALEAQEKQATLTQSVAELKKEIMELKNWDREKERYEVTQVTWGIRAYAVKPGMEHGEPPHHLCANCFEDNKKSIVQVEQSPMDMMRKFYRCARCKTTLVGP